MPPEKPLTPEEEVQAQQLYEALMEAGYHQTLIKRAKAEVEKIAGSLSFEYFDAVFVRKFEQGWKVVPKDTPGAERRSERIERRNDDGSEATIEITYWVVRA